MIRQLDVRVGALSTRLYALESKEPPEMSFLREFKITTDR
jgi:hypothetical protein